MKGWGSVAYLIEKRIKREKIDISINTSSEGRIFGGDSQDVNLADGHIHNTQLLNRRAASLVLDILGRGNNVLGPSNTKSTGMGNEDETVELGDGEGLRGRAFHIEVGVMGFDRHGLADPVEVVIGVAHVSSFNLIF
jgi:hypothetical protein